MSCRNLIFLLLIFSIKVWGFNPFALAKDTIETIGDKAAIGESALDLLSEVTNDAETQKSNEELRAKIQGITKTAQDSSYTGEDIQDLISPINFSSQRVEQNIRQTISYVRRLKRVLLKLGVMSPQGVTAVNTAETNVSLSQVNQNLTTLMLQNAWRDASEKQAKLSEEKRAQDYLISERNYIFNRPLF